MIVNDGGGKIIKKKQEKKVQRKYNRMERDVAKKFMEKSWSWIEVISSMRSSLSRNNVECILMHSLMISDSRIINDFKVVVWLTLMNVLEMIKRVFWHNETITMTLFFFLNKMLSNSTNSLIDADLI